MTEWLTEARTRIEADPAAIDPVFPAVSREVGRDPVRPDTDPDGVVHGGVDDDARAGLVALAVAGGDDAQAAALLRRLYRYGDDGERRGVLRGLGRLDDPGPATVEAGLELVADALRTNDTRLVATAMGDFAATHLDQHAWRHGVLKLVFMGVSLDAVSDLEHRRDDEVARMATDFAAERRAAGRTVPADIDRLTAPLRTTTEGSR